MNFYKKEIQQLKTTKEKFTQDEKEKLMQKLSEAKEQVNQFHVKYEELVHKMNQQAGAEGKDSQIN